MARRRPNPPVIHMLVAMLVVLLPALLATAWFTRIPDPPVNRVDPAPVIEAAVAAKAYPVAAPSALPAGWQCTRARFTRTGEAGLGGQPALGNTLALGYLTPQQVYIGLDQRDANPESLVAEASRKGRPDGSSTVAGRTWTRLVSEDGRTRALADTSNGVATVISGDLAYEALEAFAGTLSFRS